MPSPVSDEVFARHLWDMGAATLEQVEEAKEFQAAQARAGRPVSLAQALVEIGVLAPMMRDNLEKRLAAPQGAVLKQLGPYRIIRKLGEGGMGAVYLAEDANAGRQVAVKVLPPELAADPEFLSRFRREAIATGKLNHENIVAAYTFAEDGGVFYYAMEYCSGQPLDELLERVRFLHEEVALQIVLQVARGLGHAHKHGVIHRDIKPSNIFLTQDGVAKILDLGLSKQVGRGGKSFTTMTGAAVGTPYYISPEQVQGVKQVDGRSDIYSLGATFYHLVTGQVPFEALNVAGVLLKHLTEQLPNPQDLNPDLSDAVVQVIAKMMAKEPDDRYRDCKDLLEDLELITDGKMPSSQAVDLDRSSVGRSRRRGAGVGAGAAADAVGATPGPQSADRRGPSPVRQTGQHAPVGAVEVTTTGQAAPRRRGTGGHPAVEPVQGTRALPKEQGEAGATVRAPSRKMVYVGGGIAAACLLVLVLVIVLAARRKPENAPSADGAAEPQSRAVEPAPK